MTLDTLFYQRYTWRLDTTKSVTNLYKYSESHLMELLKFAWFRFDTIIWLIQLSIFSMNEIESAPDYLISTKRDSVKRLSLYMEKLTDTAAIQNNR